MGVHERGKKQNKKSKKMSERITKRENGSRIVGKRGR